MNTQTKLRLSKTEIDIFTKGYREGMGSFKKYRGLRLGQAFHQYFKLEKITDQENKIFCDRLYESSGDEANKMIESITDYDQ